MHCVCNYNKLFYNDLEKVMLPRQWFLGFNSRSGLFNIYLKLMSKIYSDILFGRNLIYWFTKLFILYMSLIYSLKDH